MVIKTKLLSIISQKSFLRKIQAHCDILESTNTSCSSSGIASCGGGKEKDLKKKDKQIYIFSHTFLS